MTYSSQQHKAGWLSLFGTMIVLFSARAQDPLLTTNVHTMSLPEAVKYAVSNQPRIQQSLVDEQITASTIRSKLADWYPQVNFNFGLQHNFILQTSVIGGNPIKFGVNNTSAGQFTVNQAIFNRDVLLARRTKEDLLLQTRQTTASNKIDLAIDVSKAFYDVLTTMQQISIATANISRIERSLKDATSQYKAGIADKIDYKRATINLNNTKATKKINEELVGSKMAYLKFLMGYPDSAELKVSYDSLALEREMLIDTAQAPDYRNRIEYRLLETQMKLLESTVVYNRLSFLPTVSANAAYNLNFQNNSFTKLYNTNFPNSFAGITVGFPIFQGGKRKADLQTASLQLQRTNQDLLSLRNSVDAQYRQSLAAYKSGLQSWLAQKENVALAQEVYDVINLQYRAGIKTYLEVITAETDLRTAQINYYNALYQVLSAKVDVQDALGQITY